MTGSVLIIDDEPNIRRMMETIHRNAGWKTASAEDGDAGLTRLQAEHFDVVYLDLALGNRDGIDVLREIRLRKPDQVVVILTGHGTVEKAVEAIKLGAFDFLEKDFGKEKILITSRNALERCSLAAENRMLRDRQHRRQELLGNSDSIKAVLEQVAKVAPTNARVLICGESGTGKELIAREIHERSKRSSSPFVKINCAAIPEDLIEAELFGSVKGAYTGSVATRQGKFQEAHGGTLFLDEIGDMSLRVQTKVLRALQEGEVEKVGDNKTIKVDVRVLAATNKDLNEEVTAGRFREDLFFRLSVVPIVSPPLRSHREDIPILIDAFLDAYCAENELPRKTLHPKALEALERYTWPGNVRELRNQVERMVIMSPDNVIQMGDLASEILASRTLAVPLAGTPDREATTLQEAKQELERALILRALEHNEWNITKAAEELGLERTNLHKKLKQYGIAKAP
ncbi:sigma-54 dependent transcriptional regulator [bacterium]|nr:sigma-54 dependent transcriptional regulator [bacterium]